MFASQDNGSTRKIFQKPNILRRKPKANREAPKQRETPDDKPAVSVFKSQYPVLTVARSIPVQLNTTNIIETAQPSGMLQADTTTYSSTPKVQQINTPMIQELHQSNTFTLFGQIGNDMEQASLNIDSFLVENPKKQSDVSNEYATLKLTEVESKWCLNFMSEDSKDIVTPTFYDGSQIRIHSTDIVNTDSITPMLFENGPSLLQDSSEAIRQSYIQNCLNSRVVKYKCDMPNCSKSFWNEARLQKHKLIHLRQKTTTAIIECPVKKVDNEGVEQRCGKYFPTRDVLLKHLNEDHAAEDAAYRCTRCGRRFWWATGMRTHAQSPCMRAPLACTWPGCGRIFRQPCRLREHARAHTGDRPYPCTFPNCGWAFRSASKLVRHARRHTGERRHECGACGRAFLRREHLRDHAARSHAPPSAPRPCTHQGCEETFENMSSLYVHLKKVHSVERPKPVRRRAQRPTTGSNEDMLLMTLAGGSSIVNCAEPTPDEIETLNATALIMPEEEVDDFSVVNDEEVIEEEARGEDLEGMCARTHLPYPLRMHTDQAFAIEDDTQVEQSEGSESNIYTVRSDLFLHGNVLINEDSEFIIRESSNRATSETPDTPEQLEGLGLIDSHPTIDLMQEELMYGDAAVDESSFRVFLMNGEELS